MITTGAPKHAPLKCKCVTGTAPKNSQSKALFAVKWNMREM